MNIQFRVFLGREIHKFKIPQKIFIHFTYIAYNLKSTNSSVHKHVHHHQTMKISCQWNWMILPYLICIIMVIHLLRPGWSTRMSFYSSRNTACLERSVTVSCSWWSSRPRQPSLCWLRTGTKYWLEVRHLLKSHHFCVALEKNH